MALAGGGSFLAPCFRRRHFGGDGGSGGLRHGGASSSRHVHLDTQRNRNPCKRLLLKFYSFWLQYFPTFFIDFDLIDE